MFDVENFHICMFMFMSVNLVYVVYDFWFIALTSCSELRPILPMSDLGLLLHFELWISGQFYILSTDYSSLGYILPIFLFLCCCWNFWPCFLNFWARDLISVTYFSLLFGCRFNYFEISLSMIDWLYVGKIFWRVL